MFEFFREVCVVGGYILSSSFKMRIADEFLKDTAVKNLTRTALFADNGSMDIISYQIAGPSGAAVFGKKSPPQAAAASFPQTKTTTGTARTAGIFDTFGLSAAVLRQYRRLFTLVGAGIVFGFALHTGSLYRDSFARIVDLVPYNTLERRGLDVSLEHFALGSVSADGGESGGSDELALFAAGVKDAAFVFSKPVAFVSYTVQRGDTVSGISAKFNLKYISTLIAANNIGNVREIQAGQRLRIPSIDGLNYTVKDRDTLAGLSTRYNIAAEDILDVNDLPSENLVNGQVIFIPGAQMDNDSIRRALGELFASPLRGRYRLTSGFGYRRDPFTGVRQHHNGLDMAAPLGTAVRAAMSGTVVTTGWSNVYGNYIIINHGNGYQTLYGHLNKIQAAKNAHVSQGAQIGLVGSTGYSTGPHLHFTVYRNGRLVNPATVLRL